MLRMKNTRGDGAPFDYATIEAVWQKAARISGSAGLRRDDCGAPIERTAFGRSEGRGWDVVHVYPPSQGGGDNLANLIPLHWENSAAKGDIYPEFTCKVCS